MRQVCGLFHRQDTTKLILTYMYNKYEWKYNNPILHHLAVPVLFTKFNFNDSLPLDIRIAHIIIIVTLAYPLKTIIEHTFTKVCTLMICTIMR